jgi:hypothetical protein
MSMFRLGIGRFIEQISCLIPALSVTKFMTNNQHFVLLKFDLDVQQDHLGGLCHENVFALIFIWYSIWHHYVSSVHWHKHFLLPGKALWDSPQYLSLMSMGELLCALPLNIKLWRKYLTITLIFFN